MGIGPRYTLDKEDNDIGQRDQSVRTRVFSVQYACPRDPEREKIKDHFMTCAERDQKTKWEAERMRRGGANVALVFPSNVQQHKFPLSHR